MKKKIAKLFLWIFSLPLAIVLFLSYLVIISNWFFSGGDPFHDPKNWQVGKNGEPPFIHEERYNQQYTILYTDYLKTIDLLFSFANEAGFSTIQFSECFADALSFDREDDNLPCGAVYFEKGAPTKYLARLIITEKDVSGCKYSNPKFITFSIVHTSSGKTDMTDYFIDHYESKFKALDTKYQQIKQGWSKLSCLRK